jgi:hypothetical protein
MTVTHNRLLRRHDEAGTDIAVAVRNRRDWPPLKRGQAIIRLARAVGFEPTTNRFGLFPQLLAVPDYVITLGQADRVSGARGRVIGWDPHRLVSTPSRLPQFPSPGLARRCPRHHTLGFRRIHPIFDRGYPRKCQHIQQPIALPLSYARPCGPSSEINPGGQQGIKRPGLRSCAWSRHGHPRNPVPREVARTGAGP